MRATSVSVGITKNLGNFQSLRLDVTIEVAVNESPAAIMEIGKAMLHGRVGDMSEAMDLLDLGVAIQDAWETPEGVYPLTGEELRKQVIDDVAPQIKNNPGDSTPPKQAGRTPHGRGLPLDDSPF